MSVPQPQADGAGRTGLGWPRSERVPPTRDQQHLGWPEHPEGSDPAVLVGVAPGGCADADCVEPSPYETSAEPPVDGDVPRETSHPSPLARTLAEEHRRRKALSTAATERPERTRILTVANQKGGVGKTTTAVNVAAALAQQGMRVLVLDMDPQGNASTALGVPHAAGTNGVYDVLIDGLPLADVVQSSSTVDRLWCAPATIDLAGAEIELVPLRARESRLRTALDTYLAGVTGEDRFDFVLVDCPPSLGLLTVNAFVAAREVLIPIQCEYYALEGVSQLLANIDLIRGHLNPELRVSTVLLTMYDGRTRLSAQVADEVRSHFADQVLKTSIPRSVRISEAPSHGETVMTYDPSSSGALSYREVAVEMTVPGADVSAAPPTRRSVPS